MCFTNKLEIELQDYVRNAVIAAVYPEDNVPSKILSLSEVKLDHSIM